MKQDNEYQQNDWNNTTIFYRWIFDLH